MGVVISSVVAAGPAVLEDLETPYAVIQERRSKQEQKQKPKARLRRQKPQIQFEPSSSRQSKTSEERKKSNSNARSTSINSSAPSRPQSRNSKVKLKRQNSLDVSSPSPRPTNAEEKIRMMLSTPKPSKKQEPRDIQTETEENIEATGISAAVKDTIDTMFQQVKETTDLEAEIKCSQDPEQLEAEELISLADSTKTDSRSVRSVKRASSVTAKQKLEMLRHLPTARIDEYKTYTTHQPSKAANNKHKKSNGKLVNLSVKENKRGDS